MKHQITPEQFSANEDAPSAILDAPFKAFLLPYHAEAGAYVTLALPNNFDNAIRFRVHFLKSGGATRMGVDVGFNFYPLTPTSTVAGSVACDMIGSDGEVTTSDWCNVSADLITGTMISMKVAPSLEETTEDEATVIAMIEVDLGVY